MLASQEEEDCKKEKKVVSFFPWGDQSVMWLDRKALYSVLDRWNEDREREEQHQWRCYYNFISKTFPTDTQQSPFSTHKVQWYHWCAEACFQETWCSSSSLRPFSHPITLLKTHIYITSSSGLNCFDQQPQDSSIYTRGLLQEINRSGPHTRPPTKQVDHMDSSTSSLLFGRAAALCSLGRRLVVAIMGGGYRRNILSTIFSILLIFISLPSFSNVARA